MKKYRRNQQKNRFTQKITELTEFLIKFINRHRIKIAASLVASVLVLIVGIYALDGLKTLPPEEERTVEVVVPETALSRQYLREACDSAHQMIGVAERYGVDVGAGFRFLEMDVAELHINGRVVATTRTAKELSRILDYFKLRYVSESADIVRVDFVQNVQIESARVPLVRFHGFDSEESIKRRLEVGYSETREHEIQPGENYWIISQNYGIEMEELEAANPDVDPAYLVVGQKIKLVAPSPLLTVVSVENIRYSEDIEYQTVYEETDRFYRGQSRVKYAGSYGEVAVEASLIRENGVVINKTVVSEDVVVEPEDEVVYVGIKDPPPRMGTGVLGYPLPYYEYVSSEFGDTLYRYFPHTGIDLVCSVGTEVYAADGGTVVASGWSGSYGYRVLIDHGGNIETLYAHCSGVIVDVGEQVYQGQVIGYSGNTGYSTGPHLHFEVRLNGVYQNPRYYLDF